MRARALLNGIKQLQRAAWSFYLFFHVRTQHLSIFALLLFHYEHMVFLKDTAQDAILEAGQPSPGTKSASTLTLDIISRTARSTFMLFTSHPGWHFDIATAMDQDRLIGSFINSLYFSLT
jgi:hypothetical protein